MYLSNRDIKWAIECGHLTVEPPPEQFGAGYDAVLLRSRKLPLIRARFSSRAQLRSQAKGEKSETRGGDARGGSPPHVGRGSDPFSHSL
jgi:hypothetical protein